MTTTNSQWDASVGIEPAASGLARLHALSDRKPDAIPSLSGLAAMHEWLFDAHSLLRDEPAAEKAAEWLMDNAYVVDRAIRQIREDLPPGYYTKLRALAIDDGFHTPRIYDIGQGIVLATNLQLTTESITRFISAYQRVQKLDLAELWALPTILRLACIERLVASVERLAPKLMPPFEVTRSEQCSLLLDDTECVARCIRGLSTLDAISWSQVVEATSTIDVILRSDPARAYSKMDIQTRDMYRRSVEDLARRSHRDEEDVAQRALALSRSGTVGTRSMHVGFWLIAEGREHLERSLRYRIAWPERGRRILREYATGIYLGGLLSLTALFVLLPGVYIASVGARPAVWVLSAAVLLLPASMLAVTTLHWTLSRILPPTTLPKLAFEGAVPRDCTTAVVIPSLIGSNQDVDYLLRQIELHQLSNPDPNLRFILITGFREAKEQHRPEDAALRERAAKGIAELNRRHAVNRRGPFHLLHRERRFNAVEGLWMGWERKRGKLDQLNRLLAGKTDAAFDLREGDLAGLDDVRFVITLDADTSLPQTTAARLIGTLAHPLNRPAFDSESGRVRSGYTVIQPRVETSPESGNRSLFTRMNCGDTAIDIYSRAVSDVYQDLFGTGIYVGKAIYDVAAFSRSLEGRAPENALASHDLFEGIHGRAALATDIVLYEDYPPSYLAFTRRLHRWVRGDWQLLPWLRRRVPGAHQDYLPNRFAWIDRWKIIDNLRRSLLPTALLGLLISGWTWLPGYALVWTSFAVLAPTGHLFIDFATGLTRERRLRSPEFSRSLRDQVGRWLMLLAFLPHQAAVTMDAIVRTLYRVLFTKRHLLEWTTAAHAAAAVAGRNPMTLSWIEMAPAPLTSFATAAALVYWQPSALVVAAPLLILWALSPEIARRLSQPIPARSERLEAHDVAFLRGVARRTWLYFETFVGPEGHWLPPDNYQEDPGRRVAHRTSPTNIGMLMLSTLAAYDLGYIGLEQLALRLRLTLESVGKLEHYRGHLLNWYHTLTLEPLSPRYVSSVDSGNLAAALFAVKAAASEMKRKPCFRPERWQGLTDTISLVRENLPRLLQESGTSTQMDEAEKRVMTMHALALAARHESNPWASQLAGIEAVCSELEAILLDTVTNRRLSIDSTVLGEVRICLDRVHEHIRGMQRETEHLAPWLGILEASPAVDGDHPDHSEWTRLKVRLAELLPTSLSLEHIPGHCQQAGAALSKAKHRLSAGKESGVLDSRIAKWIGDLERALEAGVEHAKQLDDAFAELARQAEGEALGMDFGLFYDPKDRHLFIGYNLTADQMDSHHYDLLASEARLTSLVAIAKGDVPAEHWFSLDRPMTRAGDSVAVLSWGGTMFEYLMPPLLMQSHPRTLLAESQRAAVLEQIADGERRELPWGVSESGFAAFDADHNYQYQAFGVQGLGRKRGLDEDRVIAPYATALALPLFPTSAIQNLRRLRELGMLGTYGFFEAIDFTPSRLPEGRDHAIVYSHMSHHQGMFLAALVNLLCGNVLVRRFESNARIQAAHILLQERVPGEFPVEEPRNLIPNVERRRSERTVALHPWRPDPDGAHPSVHALGNGRMASRSTDAGGGALFWREHAITRCLPDPTLDNAGLWIYVQDKEENTIWSVGRQPSGDGMAEFDVVFHAHMVELHRREQGVAIRTDIAIGAADDIEVRRITVVNETNRARSLAFTSYGEVVLAPARDDARHPAFSKLFVEGVHIPALDALVFTRRSRSPDDQFPIVMHRLVADSKDVRFAGFETDRERFLGRNGSQARPRGLNEGLSGRQGARLDPIMALRADVELAPFATAQLAFVTIAGPSREAVNAAAMRYETLASFEWLLSDAHAEAAREAGRLRLSAARLPELQALLSSLLSGHSELRATALKVGSNRLGQRDLWGLGISGDDPLLLIETKSTDHTPLVRDLIRAHQLWRRRGIAIDLVILTHAASGYSDDAWSGIHAFLEELNAAEWLGRRAGIHLVRADQISKEQALLLEVSASAILDAQSGPLRVQWAARNRAIRPLPRLEATRTPTRLDLAPALERPEDLVFDNGLGGFSPDGHEYVIHLGPGETCPAPWCNVLANEHFGCLVTETGGGYTWSGNSGEFRLTPWTNDPVLDPASEALYLRDEETTEVWSPTPGPAGADLPCQVRHGAGYTEWRQNGRGLASRVRVFVPTDDPVKIVDLHIRNHDRRPRRITATYYARWLLGSVFEEGNSHVVVTYDLPTRSLRATNSWNAEFAEQVAFLTSDRNPHGLTADRTEFLGREGDPSLPQALRNVGLSGRVGPGLDPCAALQVHLDIGPGEEIRTHFVLGAGTSNKQAAQLARRWQKSACVDEAMKTLTADWNSLLSTVHVHTPEPAMDLMLNRWALYQALASRILARTGFYQSSGAFGFRDQLQDVLALVQAAPERTRAHILECASHQFEQGDVLHWWHPPLGRGIRTRCSDDLLWLPYVTARYVDATGDLEILDEGIPFLAAPPLGEDERERYDLFPRSDEVAPLFEHCRRALERGFTSGAHGLPLIGDGDWNDGMNRVGSAGQGESVWLAWFAGAAAQDFAGLCERRGLIEMAKSWRERARKVFDAANAEGWDGAWYRRAFDDDGVAWGSANSDECQIDSIAQSWAVLSGGAPHERTLQALASAESTLIQNDAKIARLLWPPFDLTARDPGYIKAYPAGIRENGGQYSHAAAWLGWAFADAGDGDQAVRVFRMLNPIEHARTPDAVQKYRIEPYVITADIASVEPHTGRGGWSWYTGAAAWSWRLGVEAILGLQPQPNGLRIEPRLPRHWPGFKARVRGKNGGILEIVVEKPLDRSGQVVEILVDDTRIDGNLVDFPGDGQSRRVRVRMEAREAVPKRIPTRRSP